MNAKKHAEMMERIERHGKQLLAIFPQAKEQDPVKLCKRLRRLELEAEQMAVAYCNGEIETDKWEAISGKMASIVNDLLGTSRVWVNGDPRGYALKIDLAGGEVLHRDMGGYGIIAPDLTLHD